MQPDKSTSRITIIDDEPAMAKLVAEVAQQAGFKTQQFHHARDFFKDYDDKSDVIVLDLMMPDIDGVELIRYMADQKYQARLVLMSGFDTSVLRSAQKLATEHGLNVVGSIHKPFRFNTLYSLFKQLQPLPSPTKSNISQSQIDIEELKEAVINKDELVVHYQPQVCLKSGKAHGVEALVRWQHPQRGLIGPDNFIVLAEKNNLISELTWIVLKKVAMQCAQWRDENINITTAVNLSAKLLNDLKLPEQAHELVESYGLNESQIAIEITETALMDELDKSLEILTRLRMKNFYLSIDDFGTGYSSLVQLYRAPFSQIKIDRSFVMEMEQEKEARAIVETTIMLGHKLGMEVVAEGVETQSTFDALKHLGCDYAQGYFIARPMPAEEFTDWFRNNQEAGEVSQGVLSATTTTSTN